MGWYTRKTVSKTLEKLLKDGFFGPDGRNYNVSVYLTPRQSLERIANGAKHADKLATEGFTVLVVEGTMLGGSTTAIIVLAAKKVLFPKSSPAPNK